MTIVHDPKPKRRARRMTALLVALLLRVPAFRAGLFGLLGLSGAVYLAAWLQQAHVSQIAAGWAAGLVVALVIYEHRR